MEHLVILKPRFLDHILSGKKKIECRLSKRRMVPFEAVRAGDLLWLKRVSGPIVAQATARRVWSFELTSATQKASIVDRFGDALAAPGWLEREIDNARYATFLQLGGITPIPAIWIDKQDRRGWVILNQSVESEFATDRQNDE